jgi:phage terminase large subunit-like protein
MLPNISNIENVDDLVADFEENVQEDTKTFAINTKTNNISGFVDGLDALIQSVYLMLNIEADQYIIYPYTYGVNTLDLIGKPIYYVEAVLPDRIKETLLSDDRITDVSDFEFTADKNKLHVKFIVTSIYGTFDQETVVSY